MRYRTGLAAFLLLVPGALGQAAPAEPVDPVVPQLARLNTTLREIAGLLKKQAETQDLDLLMKRWQLGEARLADSERALKSAVAERRSLEDERGQIELRRKLMASQMESGTEMPLRDVENLTAQTELELKRVRQRLGDLTSEVEALESEATAKREEVRSWQSALDRRLGGR